MMHYANLYIGLNENYAVAAGVAEIIPNYVSLPLGAENISAIKSALAESIAHEEIKVFQNIELTGKDFARLSFCDTLPVERLNDLLSDVLQLTKNMKETGKEHAFYTKKIRYNMEKINEYNAAFCDAFQGKYILRNGEKWRIAATDIIGTTHGKALSAALLPPKSRKKGYWLHGFDLMRIGLENGFSACGIQA